MQTDGIALLDKPAGVSSHGALGPVKRALGTGRVGHTGTLDPFATGLLVVLCGSHTKIATLFESHDKTYVARIRLGVETDTLDPEGGVVKTGPVPDEGQFRAAIPGFVGTIQQVPPAYSAVHVEGRRSYQAARAGLAPALAPRLVHVQEITVLGYEPPYVDLAIRCSRGTYIRSLARDLAEAAGSCAHLAALRRTAAGGLRVQEAVAPGEFSQQRDLMSAGQFVRRHRVLPAVVVSEAGVLSLEAGRAIPVATTQALTEAREGALLCVAPDDGLVAVAEVSGEWLRPTRVLRH